jgi:hypothetical protein
MSIPYLLLCRLLLALSMYGLLLIPGKVMAQDKHKPQSDTIRVTADSTALRFDERMMSRLRTLSERKTIMGKLLKSILVFEQDPEPEGMDAEIIQRAYKLHDYKIVRNIRIINLDAFGLTVNDTIRVPRNILEKAGNAIHFKTRKYLIRNKLLFEQNEVLEPLDLLESERLLRQTDYLLDARILVDEQSSTQDSVDIFVITKDIFSLGGSGSFSPPSGSGRLSLRELNFMGWGHQVKASYRFNLEMPQPWEFSGAYRIESIGKTYLSANLIYVNQNFYQERGAYLNRDFYTTTTKYAGAVGASWIEERILLPTDPSDPSPNYGLLRYSRQDAWLGRAFALKTYNLGYDPRGRIVVGARVINTHYDSTATPNFKDNRLFLGSIGYSVRKYYKDRYLYGFGRTEDIPTGGLISFTSGYEDGALENRRYIGASTSFAMYRKSTGYLFGSVTFGSFVHHGNWQQGVLDVQSFYFTRLYEMNQWKLRHFVLGRATYGIRRNPEDLLSIDNDLGLRGFQSEQLRGQKRVAFSYEANMYTPFSLFGFKVATIAFADVAWLSYGSKSSPFKTKPYSGYGIGFRFLNEYLTFNTIQILFSYYPKLPINEDRSSYRIYQSSRAFYDFTDFTFSRPGIAEFR